MNILYVGANLHLLPLIDCKIYNNIVFIDSLPLNAYGYSKDEYINDISNHDMYNYNFIDKLIDEFSKYGYHQIEPIIKKIGRAHV